MMLKRSTVIDGGYPLLDSSIPTHITFGKEGACSMSDKETMIGSYKALVCDDNSLLENLVSPNPLVDSGHVITLHKKGGLIQHPITGQSATILREGPRWKVWLNDIHRLSLKNYPTDIINDDTHAFKCSTTTLTLSERENVIELHERLAHASVEAMCNAVSGSKPTWKQNPKNFITASVIRKVFKTYQCVDCTLVKRNIASPSSHEKEKPFYAPGETVSVDPVGPINPPTKEGFKWFILFKCVSTGYLHAFAVKTKDCLLRCLAEVIDWYRARGYSPRILRSDNDTVILSQETQNYLAKMQMIHQLSAPYRHFQNAVEREVQTVTKGVSLLLHSQPWLPSRLWHLALFHYVSCRNNTPNVHNKYKTPAHVISKVTATDLTNTFSFTFGDVVAVGIPKELRTWKFDLRNDVDIYVGQPEGSVDTHHVYYPDDDVVKTRGSVHKIEISNQKFLNYFKRRKDLRSSIVTSIPEILSFPPNEESNSDVNVSPLSFPLASTDTAPIPIRKS